MASRKVSVAIVGEDRLSGPLAGMRGSLSAFRASSEQAGQGLGRIGNLLGDMARQSVGATGPLGRLLEKVLEFGIGGGAFALLAGGVALAVGLFRKLGAEAEDASKKAQATIGGLNESADRRAGVPLREQIAETRLEIARLQQQLAKATPFARALGMTDELETRLARAKRAFMELGALASEANPMPEITATAPKAPTREELLGDKPLPGETREQTARRLAEFYGEGMMPGGVTAPGSKPLEIQKFDTTDQLDPAAWLEFGDAASGSISSVNAELENLSINLGEMQSGFLGVFEASVAGADDFAEATIGAVGKAIKGTARLMGREQFAKGAAKLAEGIFPPNPAAILSGLKHIAAGSLFMALAGGGGGSPGGGGGLGSGQFTRDQRALAEGRNVPRTLTLRRGYIRTDDPDVQDFFRDLLGGADNRDVTLRYTG